MVKKKEWLLDIQGRWQAAGDKGTGKEVRRREEDFPVIDAGQWQQTAVVINDLQQGQLPVALRKPTMR